MTMHVHCAVAKKDISNGGESLKRVWDDAVKFIVEFRVRFLTGDFNVALWCVIVELRARCLHANLLAWYPWKNNLESHVRMDSCAMISIIRTRGGGEKDARPIVVGS